MLRTVLFLTAACLGAVVAQSYTPVTYSSASARAGYVPRHFIPVHDTPEVAAAKKSFQQEFQRRAKLAEEAPDTHQYTQQQPSATYTLGKAPMPVQDTYEVATAKRAFQQEFQRRAKLAEEAPDTYQYTQQQPSATYTLVQAPMPVQDTYEVATAKRAFQQEFQRRAKLAEEASNTYQYTQQQPSATYTLAQAPMPVQDTYEVATAKRAFQQEFQRRAKLAEEAPNTYQYTQQQPSATYTLAQAPMPVQDTYEVAVAKRAFQQEFQRRAAMAASASYN